MRRCLTARVPTAQSIINAYKDSRQFFQVHVGYTTMSDEELGLNTLISRDEGGSKSITARGPGTSEEMVLQLAKQHPEVELLELAATWLSMTRTMTSKKRAPPPPRAASFHQSQPLTESCHLDIRRKSSSRKCRSPDEGMQAFKQSYFINQPSRDTREENEPAFSIHSAHKPSLFTRNGEELHDNCVLWCLVISPAGWAIYDYRSSLELLTALHDATEEVSSERSSAQHLTGTMEFIAIEVLLYIDMILSRSSTSLSGSFTEKEWFTDSHRDAARFKRSDMGADGFEDIFHLSSPKYLSFAKTLCRAIREILSPFGDRGIIVGTPQDQNRLFNPIEAYDDAIFLLGMSSDLMITEGAGPFYFVAKVCTFAMEGIISQLA
ncbi:hypothetical protein ACO22_03259 [Paracoccidioides brasiliensis]|uniref:Fungal-type protein kinase domain-containing protein n=1 Tax=Paracoccidioides brasiliensis TaxID=121759 RepID=A0A1D2JGN2_PARBR|nr:hypothetical protein ACO22_03259 [Paracoccidioides brasiliensis]